MICHEPRRAVGYHQPRAVHIQKGKIPLFGLKGQELLIILIILILVFGARKLPDLARSLGSSAKEFRKGIEEGAIEDTPSTSPLHERTVDVSMMDTPPPDS